MQNSCACLSAWKHFLRQTLYVVTRNIEGLQFNLHENILANISLYTEWQATIVPFKNTILIDIF